MNVLSKLRNSGYSVKLLDGERILINPVPPPDWVPKLREQKPLILNTLIAESGIGTQGVIACDQEYGKRNKLARDFYNHLFGEAKRTNCCYAPVGRYCKKGRKLKEAYYSVYQ